MKLLLDTHTFLWWACEPSQLSATVLGLCCQEENSLFLSVVSLWEIHIKQGLGKLQLQLPLEELLAQQQQTNSLQILPVLPSHVFCLPSLPFIHKDPFDRLLLAQAYREGMTLLTKDALFARYPVPVVW